MVLGDFSTISWFYRFDQSDCFIYKPSNTDFVFNSTNFVVFIVLYNSLTYFIIKNTILEEIFTRINSNKDFYCATTIFVVIVTNYVEYILLYNFITYYIIKNTILVKISLELILIKISNVKPPFSLFSLPTSWSILYHMISL